MNNKTPIRIAFDIGGVISKYPDILRPIFHALQQSPLIEVFVITDMDNKEKVLSLLNDNGFALKYPENLLLCDWSQHGESCKSLKCKEYKIDVHIDDLPSYVADGAKMRLLLMPDLYLPYYSEEWKTNPTHES